VKRAIQYIGLGLAGGALAFYNIGCGGGSGTAATTAATIAMSGTASTGGGTGAVAAAPKQGIVDSMFAYLNGDISTSQLTTRIGDSFTPSASAGFGSGAACASCSVVVKDLGGTTLGSGTTNSSGAWSSNIAAQNLDGYYVEVSGGNAAHTYRKIGKSIKSTDTTAGAGDISDTTTAMVKVIETLSGVTFPSTAAKTAANPTTGTLAVDDVVNTFTSAINSNPTGPIGSMVDNIQTNYSTILSNSSLYSSILGSSTNVKVLSSLTSFNNAAVKVRSSGATSTSNEVSVLNKIGSVLSNALDTTSTDYALNLANTVSSASNLTQVGTDLVTNIETNVLNITTTTINTTLTNLTTQIDLRPIAKAYADVTGSTNWKHGISIPAGGKVDVTANNAADASLSPASNNLTRTCAAATGTAACTYSWDVLDSTSTSQAITSTAASATLDTSALTAGSYTIKLIITNGAGTSTDIISLTVLAAGAVIPNVAITAPASSPWYVNNGSAVTLTATVTDNANATLSTGVTNQWTILSAPTGSTATLSTATTTSSSITPDKVGTYTIEFKATADGVASTTTTITAVGGTAPTSAPTGLAITGGTTTAPSASLSWTALTGSSGYYVYRQYSGGAVPTFSTSDTPLTTVTSTSYTDNAMLTSSYPYGNGYYSVAGYALTATSGVRGAAAVGPAATAVYCYGYTSTCQ
jgi:CheY-specific phosphatase CheX